MPKLSPYTLIWSEKDQYYELQHQGKPQQFFPLGDEVTFSHWLQEHTCFAFEGQVGEIFVFKCADSEGTGHWYASKQGRSREHLGLSSQVTFACLEELALEWASEPPSSPLAQGKATPLHEQGSPLLKTKLAAPRLPSFLVERSHLQSLLAGISTSPFTLVSASAGSGKTTLLSAWVAASNELEGNERRGIQGKLAIAWLSLEELDNDLIRFWASCIAALRRCLPALGKLALSMLHSHEALPPSTWLSALLNEIVELDRELILILDDYHVISDHAIHESLHFLLNHLPENLHLVLATRTDPDLPLSRLRMRGQMLEIRNEELRFRQQEAARFLVEGMRLPLSEEEVATLQVRTDGWIAALQLAALSLRKQQDLGAWISNFAGSHRYLQDYVQQDILAHLPGSLQQFLLHTSILTSMNAAVCHAVTASLTREECQQMLEELERANLFVIPLDEQRTWYRYHDLFREALLTWLQTTASDLVPLLHERAAHFYEEMGEYRPAIAHALAASDHQLAASLMEQAAPHFWLNGEAQTMLSWVLTLPDLILGAHLYLALETLLRSLNSVQMSTGEAHAHVVTQVERIILRIETLLHSKSDLALSNAQVQVIERRLRLLRALSETRTTHMRGDRERLIALSRELEAWPVDQEVRWNLIPLILTYLQMHTLGGEGGLLVEKLREALQQMIEVRDHLGTLRVMNMLVLVYLKSGQLHQARQLSLSGIALVETIGGRTWDTGYFYYALFEVYYAWNQLKEASDALQRQRRIAQDWQQVSLLALGERAQVQLSLARGDLPRAELALQRLEALVEQERFDKHTIWLEVARAQYWLANQSLSDTLDWAARTLSSMQIWDPPLPKRKVLMLARVLLAHKQPVQALDVLSRFREQLDRPADIEGTIHFLALSVLALHFAGKKEQAGHVAARLFALTEPEGYIRVYLDLGETMKQVLLALLSPSQQPTPGTTVLSHSFILKLLRAFEQEQRQGYSSVETAPLESQRNDGALLLPAGSSLPMEPLSRREQEVLRLLAEGATNQEIARALVIELSTVKKHVGNLLSKLGVKGRSQAVARARDLSLL